MKPLTIAQWVRAAIAAKNLSQAELSRRLQQELHRSYDRSMVYKMLKGERDVTAAELVAIERITGLPVPSDLKPEVVRIPLLPWVAAGQLADATTTIAINDVPLVAVADLGAGEFFALRVEDDAMDRISPAGSIIVVNRTDRDLVADRLYVFRLNHGTTYRRWHAQPPYLAPASTNPAHEPILLNRKRDVVVVGRVRRTLLDL